MKCIYCGKSLNENITKCPICGKATQIVPDYSIYDDDNIHVLLEGSEHILASKETDTNTTKQIKQQQAKKNQENKLKTSQKQQDKMFLKLISMICVVIIVIGMIVKISIDNSRKNSLEYQLEQGNTAFAEQNYEQACAYFKQANRISPNDCEVLFSLARTYLKLEQKQQAIDCLLQIIELDNTYIKAYGELITYYETQQNTQAILELMKTTENAQVLQLFKNYTVEMPSASVKEGTYQEYIKVSLSSKMNTKIYYTLDGTDPIQNGIRYKGQIFMDERGTFTLKAVAQNGKGVYSDILIQTYVIDIAPPSYPSVSHQSGTYTEETYISIDIPDRCSVYYTWDNTTPTENSTLYVAPIPIPEGRNHVLSVVIIDNDTGLASPIYRGSYDYIPESESTEEVP